MLKSFLRKKLFFILFILGFVALLLAAIFIFKSYFSRGDRTLRIDQTAIIIQEINKISQLFTSVYYDELVLDTFKLQPKPIPEQLFNGMLSLRPGFGITGNLYPSFRRIDLVVIARGKVLTGYDLSLLQETDLIIEGNAIKLQLPPAEVLEVIINPSDYEIFIEEGTWSLEEAVALNKKAAIILKERAIQRGVFKQSETMAIRILTNFFLAMGFEHVTILTDPQEVYEEEWFTPGLNIE